MLSGQGYVLCSGIPWSSPSQQRSVHTARTRLSTHPRGRCSQLSPRRSRPGPSLLPRAGSHALTRLHPLRHTHQIASATASPSLCEATQNLTSNSVALRISDPVATGQRLRISWSRHWRLEHAARVSHCSTSQRLLSTSNRTQPSPRCLPRSRATPITIDGQKVHTNVPRPTPDPRCKCAHRNWAVGLLGERGRRTCG